MTNIQKQTKVLVAGRGKLATELMNGLSSEMISTVISWEERSDLLSDSTVVVHAGSGRQMTDIIEYCGDTHSVLFELSTAGTEIPKTVNFPVIVCPNVNLQMLYFMAMVKQYGKYFKDQDIQITESHQSTKKTKPGTALYLAESLNIPDDDIVSKRDPEQQRTSIGIPEQHLDRHAFHQIMISDSEVEIKLETKVLGKTAYAKSLSKIIELVLEREPGAGHHDVVDFIEK